MIYLCTYMVVDGDKLKEETSGNIEEYWEDEDTQTDFAHVAEGTKDSRLQWSDDDEEPLYCDSHWGETTTTL